MTHEDEVTLEELLEEFCKEFEDAILMTFLASLFIWTISLVSTFAKDEKNIHFTLSYHWRMLGFWICIASTIVGLISGALCSLREMDKKVARESNERWNREQEQRKLEDALKRAIKAEADLAKCQEACCKKPDGTRHLPAKGTCVHNNSRANPRLPANNDRRVYR